MAKPAQIVWTAVGLMVVLILGAVAWTVFITPLITPTTPTPTTTGPTPPPTRVPAYYQIYGLVKYRNGTVAGGQTVNVFTPNADGSEWISQGSASTGATGYFTGPQLKEGQTYLLQIAYNATEDINDQYFEGAMPWAPSNWAQATLTVDPVTIEQEPNAQASHMAIYAYFSNGSAITSTAAAANTSFISKSGTTYPKTSDPITISLRVTQAWKNFGGHWKQYKTNLGTTAKEMDSVVRISMNFTTGFTWVSEGWTMISGPATTRNMTMIVPAVITTDTTPGKYDFDVEIDFTGMSNNDIICLRVDWIDSQVWSTVTAGSTTTRNAPEAGYYYMEQAVFYMNVTA